MAYIPLTKGYTAVIDTSDLGIVGAFNWSAVIGPRKNVYAVRGAGADRVYLHRLIVGAPDGWLVDHEDGDTLNCRRSNLRPCTKAQNCQNAGVRVDNQTGQRGVSRRPNGRYRARIQANGRAYDLGIYATAEEAAIAFEEAARNLHGEFAPKEARPSLARASDGG